MRNPTSTESVSQAKSILLGLTVEAVTETLVARDFFKNHLLARNVPWFRHPETMRALKSHPAVITQEITQRSGSIRQLFGRRSQHPPHSLLTARGSPTSGNNTTNCLLAARAVRHDVAHQITHV